MEFVTSNKRFDYSRIQDYSKTLHKIIVMSDMNNINLSLFYCNYLLLLLPKADLMPSGVSPSQSLICQIYNMYLQIQQHKHI